MKKLLRPQDILFLGLSNVLDALEEIKDPLGVIGKSYEQAYSFIPSRYKKQNFNHLVWRSLKTGYIEKIIKDGASYLRLTSSGKRKIERDFPLFKIQENKWDRRWRIISFDIDEINKKVRDRFRYKLKELGFGMLQKSVFITPYDITKDFAEFIEEQKLDDYVYIMEASHLLKGDIKSLVNRIWHLEELNERYMVLLDKINDLISIRGRGGKLNHGEGKGDYLKSIENKDTKNIKDIWSSYLEIVIKDPFLPKEVLPQNWLGEKAGIMMKRMKVYPKSL